MSQQPQPGDMVTPRRLVAVDSSTVTLPDPGGAFTHLLFRRYAGCPICDGVHADDNWSVDDVLALLATACERDRASLEVA